MISAAHGIACRAHRPSSGRAHPHWRNNAKPERWLIALIGLVACGLIAAGCGDDEETSTAPAATTAETTDEDTSTAEATDGSTPETTTEDSAGDDSASEAIDADGVYDACVGAVEGTPAEAQAQTACEQARTAFEQCAKQAEATSDDAAREAAIAICQQAADQAVAALEAAG